MVGLFTRLFFWFSTSLFWSGNLFLVDSLKGNILIFSNSACFIFSSVPLGFVYRLFLITTPLATEITKAAAAATAKKGGPT